MLQNKVPFDMIDPKKAYQQSTEELYIQLGSSLEGLSANKVHKRLKQYGRNEIERKDKISTIVLFLKQFASPLVYILVVAVAASILLSETLDAIVISIAILLNVIVGFVQEFKASNTLAALFSKSVLQTTVIRNGQKHLINASGLVPGDVVILKSGDKVPADGRIISHHNLEVDESLLTGESIPRRKYEKTILSDRVVAEKDNMVYMGTNVVSGQGRILIVATGYKTEFGNISKVILEAKEEKTLIQKELDRLARFLAIIFSLTISLVFLIGLFRGHSFIEMFNEGVALAVSAIPEGLPVSVTVIFAIGMQKILAKKGLIRKLLATETLGRTEILCIDKTGTLTKGKMEVEEIITFDKRHKANDTLDTQDVTIRQIITGATLCNTAFAEYDDETKFRGKPTDVALLKFGHRFSMTKEDIDSKHPVIDEYPFNQDLKFGAVMMQMSNTNRMYMIGAPEVILAKSNLLRMYRSTKGKYFSDAEKEKVMQLNNAFGIEGYRILAVAYEDLSISQKRINPNSHKLAFLGLIVISDPIRNSAVETVQRTREAGLRLAIVTGDHITTARNVARQVGIPCGEEHAIDGGELKKLSDEELSSRIEKLCVYARVSPNDKVRIVNAWKEKGKVVAMTGDGINDAPALHLADIGIALGSGTDIAKESADFVLMDDNLTTILNAVYEGRRILDNIKKVVLYLLSDGLAEVTLVGFAVILGWPLPILATQILWINLVEDGLPDIALASEPIEKDVFKIKPRIFNLPILDKELKLFSFLFGWVDDIALIVLFTIMYLTGENIDLIRTMVFTVLTLDSLFFAYSCKSLRRPLIKTKVFNNKMLNISFILGILLLIGAIYFPPLQDLLSTVALTIPQWSILIAISLLDVATLELLKNILVKKKFWKEKELASSS